MLKHFLKSCAAILLSLLFVNNAFAGINFDGTDDYVEIGAPSSLNLNGPITVSCWVYPRSSGVSQIFVGAAYKYVFWVQSNNEIRFADNQGNYVDTDANVLTLNSWNHVVGTFSGTSGDAVTLTNAKIYVNGVSRGTHTYGTWSPSTWDSVRIGYRIALSGSGWYFNGLIDEVAIWNVALTPTEISQLYNSRIKNLPLQIRPANLVAYWSLDDQEAGTSADGDTIRDLSGNGNNGTGVDGANNTGLTWQGEQILSYPSKPSMFH